MRNLIFGIIVITGLSSFINNIDGDLINAFSTGDAEKVATHFTDPIDLSTPEKEGVFSKTQATLILKTFFTKNKPSSFKIMHNGDSKNNAHYSIGNLSTSSGTYRIYLLYKKAKPVDTILELRIETIE